MSEEFWAAIVGAIVGGAIAALIQTFSLRAAKREREAAYLQTQQTTARSLLIKLVKIHSNFVGIDAHFQQCRANEKLKGLGHGWQSVIPLANLPRSVQFTSDELATLAATRDDKLFNEVLSLDELHDGIIEILGMYRAKRMALSESLPAMMAGTVGTITLTQEQHMEYAPRAAELDQLVSDLEKMISDEVDPGFSLASRAAQALNSKYGMKLQVSPIAPMESGKIKPIGTVEASIG